MTDRRTQIVLGFLTAMAALPLLSGCEKKGPMQEWVQKKVFGPSPKQMLAMAFDPRDADRRRQGVNLLAEQSWGLQEPYLKGYATLLRADEDPSVRSAAARALGRAEDPKYLAALAVALDRPGQPTIVRWDCAVALERIVGLEAEPVLRKHAEGDPSTDVRMTCARALRNYRKPRVLATLVDCLDDPAFEVRHEARQSLVALTGADHGYDPVAWAAAAGVELPPPTAPAPKRAWWDWFGVRHRRQLRERAGDGNGPNEAAPADEKNKRPWWDWFGTTVDDPDESDRQDKPARDEAAPAEGKKNRPWWDWFGTTDKDRDEAPGKEKQ